MSLKPQRAGASPPIYHLMAFADWDWQARCCQTPAAAVEESSLECCLVTLSSEAESELQSVNYEALLGVQQYVGQWTEEVWEADTGKVGCHLMTSCRDHAE